MSSNGQGFRYEMRPQESGNVALLTVIGRTRLNLIGAATITEAAAGIRDLASDPTLRCAVLQGPVADRFIGGADLCELRTLSSQNAAEFVGAIHSLCAAIREFPVPVIARISGHCLGGGLEISAACDFRICDHSAVFGMPEVRVGVPSVVEAALLPQLIGWGKTRELIYRGNLIDAAEAARIGLVEHDVGENDIAEMIDEVVADILAAAPNAIRLQKNLCRQWEQSSIEEGIEAGLDVFAQAYETDEPSRYCQQFFERNK